MTDLMESLLSTMSSTFNAECATDEAGSVLNIDLAEDKTLKWRNLVNNQFACKDKDRKHVTKSEQQTSTATATTITAPVATSATATISTAVSKSLKTKRSRDNADPCHDFGCNEQHAKDVQENMKLLSTDDALREASTGTQGDGDRTKALYIATAFESPTSGQTVSNNGTSGDNQCDSLTVSVESAKTADGCQTRNNSNQPTTKPMAPPKTSTSKVIACKFGGGGGYNKCTTEKTARAISTTAARTDVIALSQIKPAADITSDAASQLFTIKLENSVAPASVQIAATTAATTSATTKIETNQENKAVADCRGSTYTNEAAACVAPDELIGADSAVGCSAVTSSRTSNDATPEKSDAHICGVSSQRRMVGMPSLMNPAAEVTTGRVTGTSIDSICVASADITASAVTAVAGASLVASVKRGRGRSRKVAIASVQQEKAPAARSVSLLEASFEKAKISNPARNDNRCHDFVVTEGIVKKTGRKRKPIGDDTAVTAEQEPTFKHEDDATSAGSDYYASTPAAASAGDSKRTRRSIRLGNRLDGFRTLMEGASSDDIKSEHFTLVPEDALHGTLVTRCVAVGNASPQVVSCLAEGKTPPPPKKRGRKPKIHTVDKPPMVADVSLMLPFPGLTSVAASECSDQVSPQNSTSSGSGEINSVGNRRGAVHNSTIETIIPKRSQRRIKPTSKILENDELRYEFETKNIVRITAQGWQAVTTNAAAVASAAIGAVTGRQTQPQHYEVQPDHRIAEKTISDSSKGRSDKSEASSDCHPNGSSAIKKKLFSKTRRDIEAANAALEAQSLAQQRRTYTDFDKFLCEIKAAKLNFVKLPDDKKLNRKQQRKLAKQKEKHLERLGLRRNTCGAASDGDSANSNNDEFVPDIPVQVGKPNVTLRVRSVAKVTVAHPAEQGAATICEEPKAPRKQQKCTSPSQLNEVAAVGGFVVHSLVGADIATKAAKCPQPNDQLICLCQKPSQYYTRCAPESSYCCAIDHIDEQKVGCCNQVNGEILNLLRPSQCVSYLVLCDDHKKRLRAHNCCAGCGIFCTQGKFVLCKQQHFFHAICAQKFILNSPYDPLQPAFHHTSPTLVLKCPHCGLDTPERSSMVTMKCQTLPVFLPNQTTNIKPVKPVAMSLLGENMNSIGTMKQDDSKRKVDTAADNPNGLSICFEHLIPESVMNVVSRGRGLGGSVRQGISDFSTRDMYYAVKNDDLERVAEILASGYDVTNRMREFLNGTCLHLVAHSGTLQMAYLLMCKSVPHEFVNIVDRELRTASMCAVMGDKCDILNLFIQCGADLALKGPDGKTCLHIGAKLGNLDVIQMIIESCKKSNSVSSFLNFINTQDSGGWTAMVWAAELGHTEIVSLLLCHGGHPDICDNDNNTVLHWATLHNDGLETISVLLQAGVDCNVQNVDGDTPLHIACRHAVTRLCIVLIANGADLMIKNKAAELPYDCIPSECSECIRTVGFNMQMRSFRPLGLRNRIVCSDASNGRELRPIQAKRSDTNAAAHAMAQVQANAVPDESDEIMWPDFKYITKNIILQNSVQIDNRVSQMRICSCLDGCSSDQCQCTGASVQNWYTTEGRLCADFNYDDPPVIFECNDVCGCNKLTCKNRIVQNGIRLPMQVVECEEPSKGWGVRAIANVPKGCFVAEYTGEILTDFEADRRTDDSYFFDLGHEHCIDANYYGNISRFFNHSCDPNIVPVRVFFEHQDYRFPKISFFACRDIAASEEICFDYGDKFWKIKNRYFSCKCLKDICRYTNRNNVTAMMVTTSKTQQKINSTINARNSDTTGEAVLTDGGSNAAETMMTV